MQKFREKRLSKQTKKLSKKFSLDQKNISENMAEKVKL